MINQININSNTSILENYPNEVSYLILNQLGPKDLCRMAQTSRHFRIIISNIWSSKDIDTLENRKFMAKIFTKLTLPVTIESSADQILDSLFKSIEGLTEEEVEKVGKFKVGLKALMENSSEDTVEVYASELNLEEIKAQIDFYSKPAGLSVLKKTGLILKATSEKMQPKIQALLKKIFVG